MTAQPNPGLVFHTVIFHGESTWCWTHFPCVVFALALALQSTSLPKQMGSAKFFFGVAYRFGGDPYMTPMSAKDLWLGMLCDPRLLVLYASFMVFRGSAHSCLVLLNVAKKVYYYLQTHTSGPLGCRFPTPPPEFLDWVIRLYKEMKRAIPKKPRLNRADVIMKEAEIAEKLVAAGRRAALMVIEAQVGHGVDVRFKDL